MATVEATHLPQHLTALAKANAIRLGGAAVKREVKAGTITIGEALDDPRGESLLVIILVASVPRWGKLRAGKLLTRERISHDRRVRDLTVRQRGVLAETVMAGPGQMFGGRG